MGEREGFECEYGEAIDKRKEKGVAEIAYESHAAERGTESVLIFLPEIKLEHIGLKEGKKGERGGCQSGGVAEDIDSHAEQETEHHGGDA